ncbi:beta-lactamase family protein [Nocardia sp. 2]|uniref:Beta-lactamase family protein n=1 Tax=Nocardia acididurans TaxID=2802282 RepID=A0ABS1LZ64_9NOCA|nr:serine hydrolase domain-containing protein [Nocardia acididurans]MBL1073708.1 beta-lactamase family protein [Nocardia acididurans]
MRIAPSVLVIAAVLAASGCSVMDMDSPPQIAPSAVTVSPTRVDQVRADIDEIVRSGIAGVLATLTENGQTVTLTAGVADIATGAPIPMAPPQQVRVGSIGKTFVATIIMQLVGEGKIRLDDSIEVYLPGKVTGNGVDGRAITVRQILQHRSGLPEFSSDAEIDEYRAGLRGQTMTPEQELAIALRNPAQFAPGARFEYTNTNYLIAAMIIEKVTGSTYSEELTRRVTAALPLPDTYLPAAGELDIRGPHPKGYATIDGVRTDVSRIEPSVPWASGALVSTGADINHFYMSLLAGKLMAGTQLEEMIAGESQMEGSAFKYGLGIGSMRLSCGAQYFGHTGGIFGYLTVAGATPEGRAVTITLTEPPSSPPDTEKLLEHALC